MTKPERWGVEYSLLGAWRVVTVGPHSTAPGHLVIPAGALSKERAEQVVREHNAHTDLLAACETLLSVTDCYCEDGIDRPCGACLARAAIARARGEEAGS